MGSRRFGLAALVVGLVTVFALSGCAQTTLISSDTATFFTLDGSTVHLRDLATGSEIDSRAEDAVTAAPAPAGGLVVSKSSGCVSTIARVLGNGSTETILTVHEKVRSIAVSPDGQQIAYLTYPTCTDHPACSGSCSAGYLPNVLAVTELATGNTVRTATTDQGQPFGPPSWSPDGSKIATGYQDEILILSATAPSFETASAITARPGCGYYAPAWLTTGIIAANGCGTDGPELSPEDLVQITNGDGTPQTHGLDSWTLPTCIDGLTTATNADHTRLLIQSDIGYGNDACDTTRSSDVFELTGSTLSPIFKDSSDSDTYLIG